MTYFSHQGNTVMIVPENSVDIRTTLEPRNYILQQYPMGGPMYLEQTENFVDLPKYYGDTIEKRDRILNTFMSRPSMTGVLLFGEKGSGKTLLTRAVAARGVQVGCPVIIVSQPWCGDTFNKFISEIQQPAILLFDEFEKVYSKEDQEQILTLLDGVFPSKKLCMFTCNDERKINEHMRNRPGRIYYSIEYRGLGEEFVREFCTDVLNNKDHVESVVKVSSLFESFNFDMMKALVEDMNRYNESAQEAIKIINANPRYENRYDSKVVYNYELILRDPPKNFTPYGDEYRLNPILQSEVGIRYYYGDDIDGDFEEDCIRFISSTDLKKYDPQEGRILYENSNGDRLIFKKKPVEKWDYMNWVS